MSSVNRTSSESSDVDQSAHRCAPSRRRDGGFSIIEVIVTLVLIGTVVMAILSAVATSQRTSSTSRGAAQIETAIVNASDRVNRAPKRCNYTIYAQAAVQAEGWAPTRASVRHEYYVPGATAAVAGTWLTGSTDYPGCSGASPSDLLVQRVTITITTPDGKLSRSVQVVKSDV